MPLVVAEVEEGDFVRLAGISRDAWRQTWFGPAFYPGPFAADDHERKAERLRQQWKKDGNQQEQQQHGQEEEDGLGLGREGSHERWLKVIDTDLRLTADGGRSGGKEHIVSWGFARFFTEPKPRAARNGKGDLMVTVAPCLAGLPGERDESIRLDCKKAALAVDKYWGGKRHVCTSASLLFLSHSPFPSPFPTFLSRSPLPTCKSR